MADVLARRILTPANAISPLEFYTAGRLRMYLRADEPALELQPVVNDPAAPPKANRAVFFTRDNGAGKGQLCVRFPSGAVQVLATEP